MNDDNNQTRQSRSEIPRRGYDRARTDSTGRLGSTRPLPDQEEKRTTGTGRYSPPPTPPPPRRGISRERAPRDSGLYLPWWSLVILIGVVGIAAFGLLALAANLGAGVLVEPTPEIIIVTPQLQPTTPPISANEPPPTSVSPLDPTNTPIVNTAEPTRTPVPGGCLLNQEVIVFNTGGVGLNLRDEPGGEVQFIAKEGERLLVLDGPVVFEGLDWCLVRSVGQSSAFGWAARDFLLAADEVDAENE